MPEDIVSFVKGMKVGLGYNRLTGEVLPSPAVQGPSISGMEGAKGQQVIIDCITTKDVTTLHKSLGISVDAGGSYLGFSGSAKVDYVHSCDFSSWSTYVRVRVSVQNAFESIDSPVFASDAIELLKNNNRDRFRERFGDCYISGVQTGGEYFAIYQLTGSDESEKEGLAVKVHAAFNGLLASAELNTEIKDKTESSKSHLEVQVYVFRQGIISTADLDLDDIMKTAKEFPVAVAGDMGYSYGVTLQEYQRLKSPNDGFNYYDYKNQQDVLEDLAKRRFEFLALRDDLKYILKHSDDFQNADGTEVNRGELTQNYDYVVDAINTMETEAKACSRDPNQCEFTKFEVTKIKLPVLAKGPEDSLAARGEVIAGQDPLAVALRNQQPAGPNRRGFDIGMAVAEGQTLPGPGKQRMHDSLRSEEQRGFEIAVSFSLERNRNASNAAAGAAIAKADPKVSAARTANSSIFYQLGFDIATGLFGDPALGGQGDTVWGPGKQETYNSLSHDSQMGFDASKKLHLGPPPLPRQG